MTGTTPLTAAPATQRGPALPRPRGPVSRAVLEALTQSPGPPPAADTATAWPLAEAGRGDPLGEDLQLALYLCYELHYRGFAGVDAAWEWHPGLLGLRAVLERGFLAELRAQLAGGTDVAGELAALLSEPVDGTGVAGHLQERGEWWQMREFFVHRSVYHLKEADPHAWVIPRLEGRPKAALVAVEFDEFGGGRAERVHARLFADLLDGAGLDSGYGTYLGMVPAQSLAVVNLMSLLGLHRALRGALVGHFAAAEITTPPSARRLARALERMGADPVCAAFYTEHIEADAVHEQVMRHEVVDGLLAREPELAGDVVLGIQATALLEDRLGDRLLGAWQQGRSSLLRPLAL
ncbi:iron-containing redox enzyme family protein [Peterkaempfera griseoplana]|uniref:iron-containing redox enzyme family protein n=1 Tax=Peterkaempfera griseoplana TaxID=66896 RepID=UPI0006E211C0|nr:iron-containing redox enzyme family protein [Peterkaempfera griseoplana]